MERTKIIPSEMMKDLEGGLCCRSVMSPAACRTKRVLDVVASAIGMAVFSPLFLSLIHISSILLAFWEHNDRASDYFFFQILIEEYFRKHPESEPKIFNDTVPHLLRQYINENPAPGYSFSDILRKTTVHSLNYKSDVACRNLLDLFPEYRKYLN